MKKVVISTVGIKRKQRTSKAHTFTLAPKVSEVDLNDFKSRAIESLQVNMRTVYKAFLKVYELTDDGMMISPAKDIIMLK